MFKLFWPVFVYMVYGRKSILKCYRNSYHSKVVHKGFVTKNHQRISQTLRINETNMAWFEPLFKNHV